MIKWSVDIIIYVIYFSERQNISNCRQLHWEKKLELEFFDSLQNP